MDHLQDGDVLQPQGTFPREIMQYHTSEGSAYGHLWTLLHSGHENPEAIAQDPECIFDHPAAPGYSAVTNPLISSEGSPRERLHET